MQADETNRSHDIRNRNLTLMLDHSYQRVKNENLWNEKLRLSPKFKKYHIQDHSFRKSPVDLNMIKSIENTENVLK